MACTRCLLPPSLCKHWIQRPQDTKWTITNEDCSYPDVILSIFVIGVYFEEESSIFGNKYSQKLTRLGISQDHGLGEIAYLSECYDWGEIESIQLLEEFYNASKEILAIRYIDINSQKLE